MMTVVDGVVRMMIEWVGMRMGWMGLVKWAGMMIGRIESPSGQTGWMVGMVFVMMMVIVMISMISRMTIVMMMTLLLIVQSIV